MNAKPPILCVFCGADAIAHEPCPKCERPSIAGEWVVAERGAHARGVAVATLVLLAGVWCIPISWMLGGISLLFHAAGLDLPLLKVSGDAMPLEALIALGLVMPALAVGVAVILRELTAKVIGDLIDTDWHFRLAHGPHPAVTVLATTRGPKLRSAQGRVTFCEGPPVVGAEVSAADVHAAGLADVARALGEDARDVRACAELAGMIARGEIEIRRSRTSRWEYGSAATEHTGWDVRTEKEHAAAAGYRDLPVAPILLGGESLLHVHRRMYGVGDDGADEQRGGSSAEDLAKRLREWAKLEPALHREIVEMGEGQRSSD